VMPMNGPEERRTGTALPVGLIAGGKPQLRRSRYVGAVQIQLLKATQEPVADEGVEPQRRFENLAKLR